MEWIKRHGHPEDEAREIERRMKNKVRRGFPVHPEDDPEPQKELRVR